VVHADWGRPFLFRRFEDAHFPLSFVIRAREQFYPKGLEAAREGRHFVEAFYNPPGVSSPYGTFAMDPAPLTGEAWGARGKPAPLALGERADVVLAGWRVQGVERGLLTPVPRALMEGWILVPHALRSEVPPDNRVTLAVIAPPDAPGGMPRLLAAKVFENMDPEAPIAFHVLPEDLRDGALDGNARAYFVVRVECFGDDGAVVRYLEGGRASPETPIAPFVDDLQVAVTRVKRRDPLAYLEGLRGLPTSPITLR